MHKAQINEAFPRQNLNYSFAAILSLNPNCKLLINAALMTGLLMLFPPQEEECQHEDEVSRFPRSPPGTGTCFLGQDEAKEELCDAPEPR